MQTTEYLIYFDNLFEAAQFFNKLEQFNPKLYTLIFKSQSFAQVKLSRIFELSPFKDYPNTLVKVKEYHKGKVKYTTIKERTC